MKTFRSSIKQFIGALLLTTFCTNATLAQKQALAPNIDTGASASASNSMETPQDKILAKVRWDQKLGKDIPANLTFKDENGKTVQLSSYFKERPVVLMLIFYNCTMLCSEVMNGALRLFKDEDKALGFKAGRDFDIVTVSINPNEGPELAKGKKATYLKELKNSPDAKNGWHLLTGDEKNIKALADSIGYRYTYDPNTDQYAHPGGIVVTTPAGKVARYFYGVDYPGKDVRFGLIEASHNKIGSPLERVALFTCFHYNPEKGTYALGVMKLMRSAGIVTVLGMALGIVLMRRWERKTKERGSKGEAMGSGAATPAT